MTIWQTSSISNAFDYPFNEFEPITAEDLGEKRFYIRKVKITPCLDKDGEKSEMCHMVITTSDDGRTNVPSNMTYVVRTRAANIVRLIKSFTDDELQVMIEKLQPTHFIVTQLKDNKRQINLF